MKRRFHISVFLFVFALVFSLPLFNSNPASATTGWYDSNWKYRSSILIDNTTNTSTLADYQIKITLPETFNFAQAQGTGNDFRFTDGDGVTLLNHWTEDYNPSSQVGIFWVKIPSIGSLSRKTIYMYYGNPSATQISSGSSTFSFFDDFSNPAWTTLSTVPVPTADESVATINNRFYIIGGYGNGGGDPLNINYQYDPSTGTYSQKASMPTARWGEIAVSIGGVAYVFGGQAVTGGSSANEAYDPSSDSWVVKSNLPSSISKQGITGCTDGNNAYLFYNGLTYRYNVSSDTYTQLAPSPASVVSWSSCGYSNGNIYLIGGWNSGGQPYTQIYNITTNSWSMGANMPFGLYGSMRENPIINGSLYILQGQRKDGEFSSVAYAYNIATNSWTQKSFGPHAADGVAGGIYNGKLYTFGGRQDGTGPYGLRFATSYDPSQDIGTAWDQVTGNFEMSNGTLHQMIPVKGAGANLISQLQTNNYQTSGNFTLELQGNQTGNGGGWDGVVIHSNAGIYNNNLTGYLAPYNDYGVSPTATSIYKENGNIYTQLQHTSPVSTGPQRYEVRSSSSQIEELENGQLKLAVNDPTYRNGHLNLISASTNASTWSFIFTRAYGSPEPTVHMGNSETQSSYNCHCSVWDATSTPAVSSTANTSAYELGTRFFSDTTGYITSLKFYKEPGMANSHIGHLWDSNGNLLATVTYSNESASGWQQAEISSPVAITANTAYISSYVINTGPFAETQSQFISQNVDNAPLHLYKDGLGTANGVFNNGGSGFPTNSWISTNYWSDVVFTTNNPNILSYSPSVSCTSSGELCNPVYNIPFSVGASGSVSVDYTAPPSTCSSIRLYFSVDGTPTVTSEWLGWPGASGAYGHLPLDSGWLKLGPTSSGLHTLGVQAEGQPGGCNSGQLNQWGGTLSIST